MKFYIFALFITTISLNARIRADFFPITIVDNTNNPNIESIYITVKGINPETNNQCFIKFDEKSVLGKYNDISLTTNSHDFSYDSRFFRRNRLFLPHLTSGRIYISLNKKLTMPIVVDANGKLGIADPSPYNTTDPNFHLFFDKVEFTYIGENTWTNPTAVDFFALPLVIEQDGHSYGIAHPRKEVTQKVETAFNNAPSPAWKKLLVRNNQGTILRILAPGRDNTYFDANYLTGRRFNYVDDIWSYYKTHTVKVDCSELRGNPAARRISPYIYTGKVEDNIFVFSNGNKNENVYIEKPSSDSFFLGAQGAFDAPNNTPKAVIVRSIAAAWCVGLLPADNNALLRRSYFDAHRDRFYTHNPLLSPASIGKGPFYNLYGKAIHELSKTIYTWAYDDAFGYDGTNATKARYPARLIIGDMSGITIAKN